MNMEQQKQDLNGCEQEWNSKENIPVVLDLKRLLIIFIGVSNTYANGKSDEDSKGHAYLGKCTSGSLDFNWCCLSNVFWTKDRKSSNRYTIDKSTDAENPKYIDKGYANSND